MQKIDEFGITYEFPDNSQLFFIEAWCTSVLGNVFTPYASNDATINTKLTQIKNITFDYDAFKDIAIKIFPYNKVRAALPNSNTCTIDMLGFVDRAERTSRKFSGESKFAVRDELYHSQKLKEGIEKFGRIIVAEISEVNQ